MITVAALGLVTSIEEIHKTVAAAAADALAKQKLIIGLFAQGKKFLEIFP